MLLQNILSVDLFMCLSVPELVLSELVGDIWEELD